MISTPNFVLAILTFNINTVNLNFLQTFLQDVLQYQGYTNDLCGDLISTVFFLGILSSLAAAYIMDRWPRFVLISKISCSLYPIAFLVFSFVIQSKGITAIIIVTNIFLSILSAFMIQSTTQILFRTFSGILQEASVMATSTWVLTIVSVIVSASLAPLKSIGNHENIYFTPLLTYSILVCLTNILYVSTFEPPDKGKIREKLERISGPPKMTMEERYIPINRF